MPTELTASMSGRTRLLSVPLLSPGRYHISTSHTHVVPDTYVVPVYIWHTVSGGDRAYGQVGIASDIHVAPAYGQVGTASDIHVAHRNLYAKEDSIAEQSG